MIKVESRKQMKQFVAFPLHLYKNCANWVPALEGDEYDTFNPEKNGAYDFCEADCFLAYRGNEIVGRVAAIINHKADDEQKLVRFGWLDFIEDEAVLKALIDTVAEWGRQRGRTDMRGPWGFTDMDKEGLLVEGFEHLSPFTCLYNYAYYGPMLEKLGFTKEVDWTQRTLDVSPTLPSMFQFAHLIEERSKRACGAAQEHEADEQAIRLKALKKNDTLEALIMGVMPEYQQCGIPVLLFKYLHENCIKRGIDTIIMNPQLEENYKVQSLFGDYKTEPFMRRRAYKKSI